MMQTDHDWLAAYAERAAVVERELGAMFQKALTREVPEEIGTFRRTTASIRYLQRRRRTFPHRIVLLVYSSRFDPAFAADTLDAQHLADARIDGLPAHEAFARKSAALAPALHALVRAADLGAGHYVAALMSEPESVRLPLIWDVPAEDEAKAGFPRDAMWWLTFQYLCEIARMIVAYVGLTPLMLEELRHIRQNRRLARRLVCLDGKLNLYFPDDAEDRQWPLDQLPAVLQRIEALGVRAETATGARSKRR